MGTATRRCSWSSRRLDRATPSGARTVRRVLAFCPRRRPGGEPRPAPPGRPLSHKCRARRAGPAAHQRRAPQQRRRTWHRAPAGTCSCVCFSNCLAREVLQGRIVRLVRVTWDEHQNAHHCRPSPQPCPPRHSLDSNARPRASARERPGSRQAVHAHARGRRACCCLRAQPHL